MPHDRRHQLPPVVWGILLDVALERARTRIRLRLFVCVPTKDSRSTLGTHTVREAR